MVAITQNQFGGMNEAISARLLADEYGRIARNCDLSSGALKPLNAALATGDTIGLVGAQSIYRYAGAHWFAWTQDVDVVKSPIPYDVTDHICFTGDGYPRQTRNDVALGAADLPNVSYRLGLPAPAAAPTATVGGAPIEGGFESTVYYVYTFVDSWGQEGPSSLPSAAVDVVEGETVTVDSLLAAPTGAFNFGVGAAKRIYRSNTGSEQTSFQFLAEVPIAQVSYTDTTPAAELAEVMESGGWAAPPDDDAATYPSGPMKGICALPSGGLVGFTGNTLCYSEPYAVYAWPVEYRYPINDTIVGIAVTESGVLVTTTSAPVLAAGFDPAAVSIAPIDGHHPCSSKRSVVDMGDFVIYASPRGLIGFDGAAPRVLTEALFSELQWQRFSPTTIHAYRYHDRYVAFYDNGVSQGGFIFSPNAQQAPFVELDFYAVAGHFEPIDGALYLMLADRSVVTFDKGDALTATWRSKDYEFPAPVALSCAQVIADAYPISLTVVRDGVAHVFSVPSERPIRLPPGRCRTFCYEIATDTTVHSVAFASSVQELS